MHDATAIQRYNSTKVSRGTYRTSRTEVCGVPLRKVHHVSGARHPEGFHAWLLPRWFETVQPPIYLRSGKAAAIYSVVVCCAP